MSRFTSDLVNRIAPYVPGEQPRDKRYIKLNTNENPYYTCEKAVKSITADVLNSLNRYSDPECTELSATIAQFYRVNSENVLVTNGSDEALAFAFFAYGGRGLCYPDVTYGFYDVIANLFGYCVEHIPLDDCFCIDERDYYNKGKTIVIANPNAQTGLELTLGAIERIVKDNSENIVIIDQAYADFGNCNAIELTAKYKNLLVVNTFSKSRSLAGARVGYAVADKELIDDLKKVKNSFHPYNVNTLSAALACAAIKDTDYFNLSVERVKRTRSALSEGLAALNFTVLPSAANFVMAKNAQIDGGKLYELLKEKGVLVRHFKDERIKDFVRITVGTDGETAELLRILDIILKENVYENGGN
ncbi:MAG: histidinol-phosphate transaminase [Clostridiales bacterium]|nr:histidinol-phosphate transaminase [Clostridiales bacterium]